MVGVAKANAAEKNHWLQYHVGQSQSETPAPGVIL
jgi:hypothetical protein